MDIQHVMQELGVSEENMPVVLLSLAEEGLENFDSTGSEDEIDLAVICAQAAVGMMQDNNPDWPGALNDLSVMLQCRYERIGNIADLEEAISASRQAVNAAPEDDPSRARYLNNLGNQIDGLYVRTGVIGDLEEAISISRQAVDATSENYFNRAGRLNDLGIKLSRQYERTGAIGDLEEAINVAYRAVDAIPERYPERATCLTNLGNILYRRYERTGAIGDLEEAVSVNYQAVDAASECNPNHAAYLNNLGSVLENRYKRTGNSADLAEAIKMAQQAIDATPEGHTSRTIWLNSLGNRLEILYEQTGAISDLEEAISVARQSVDATPQGHSNYAAYLNNLGTKVIRRYQHTKEIGDLEEAISIVRQAVDATPEDHPDRAGWLKNLGNKLEIRYNQTGAMDDLVDATTYLYMAWNLTMATPFDRVQAASQCIKLLAFQNKTDAAISLGKNFINLLPTVNTKLLDRGDQQYVVSTFAGVAADLCALLLSSGHTYDALQFLEKGRAVILSQIIDSRSDVSHLAQKHPEIARRYEELRDEVNTPLACLSQDDPRELGKRRRQAALDLDACIREIQNIVGYERFFLGQTIAEMKECAAGGSIVVINITEFRSDAIIVSPTTTKAINLSALSASDAKVWLRKDWAGRRAERAAKNREYLAYLAWLWKSCVRQIVDELRTLHELAAPEDLLRVWWIGSDLASSMPFHAAGIHGVGTNETVYHKVISSYTPSIKALAHARKRAKDLEMVQGSSLLVVTMPTTPADGKKALPGLPGVTREKDTLLGLSQGHISAKHMEQPSVEHVLEELRHCCIAHFACHGSTDHVDPSNSGLILQKQSEDCCVGTEEGRGSNNRAGLIQDRLTVGKMSDINLRYARLAYLSACSTAENKAEGLRDEAIHVVSGFQVAGFPHVVGCLWPSVDRVCVEVASGFYSSIFRHGEEEWKHGDMAAALREAVMAVREDEMQMPLQWAQFVHYGP